MRSILITAVVLAVAVAYVPSEAGRRPGGVRGQGPRYDTEGISRAIVARATAVYLLDPG
jgi:hypothetical protein